MLVGGLSLGLFSLPRPWQFRRCISGTGLGFALYHTYRYLCSQLYSFGFWGSVQIVVLVRVLGGDRSFLVT